MDSSATPGPKVARRAKYHVPTQPLAAEVARYLGTAEVARYRFAITWGWDGDKKPKTTLEGWVGWSTPVLNPGPTGNWEEADRCLQAAVADHRAGPGLGLLKLHLDLVGQARAHKGRPFSYDLLEAAARLGYKRRPATGAFDSRRVRKLAEELLILSALYVQGRGHAWKLSGADYGPIMGPAGPVTTRYHITPGRWFESIEGARYYWPVHPLLLALATEEQGAQVGRLALRLALEAAVWLRANRKATPGRAGGTLGSLLEGAQITTLEALEKNAAGGYRVARRLRAHLKDRAGVFAHLERVGIRVTVEDHELFNAQGRGWIARFWNTKIHLEGLLSTTKPKQRTAKKTTARRAKTP